MTFTVNIAGEHDGMSEDDQRAAEYGVARHAHDLVKRLEGVTHASFGGTHYAHPDLKVEPPPPVGHPEHEARAGDIG